MRVLHLTSEFPPVIWGGLGTAVGGIVNASAQAGLAVGVLLVGGILSPAGGYFSRPSFLPDAIPSELGKTSVTSDGITFFHVSPDMGIEAGLKFARAWKPDVIHLHSAWLWQVAQAIRDNLGTPLVFTIHSLDRAEYEVGGFITHWAPQETVIHAADRLIAISESEAALLLQYCPKVVARVRIIGNGIDDSEQARLSSRRCRNGPPLIMYSGRFVDRKGIHELFAAIPAILESAPEARLVLVGGYGTAAEVAHSWCGANLQPYHDRIEFTGWLPPDAVSDWYARADILVIPSWYEPFGMVVLEGMLFGMAIAAASVGGPAEILDEGDTALLFPARETEGLVHAVTRLANDRHLRHRLGACAASEVRKTWLWPKLIARMTSVYHEIALQ